MADSNIMEEILARSSGRTGTWYFKSVTRSASAVIRQAERFLPGPVRAPLAGSVHNQDATLLQRTFVDKPDAVNYKALNLPIYVKRIVATLATRAGLQQELCQDDDIGMNCERLIKNRSRIVSGLPIDQFMPTGGPTYLYFLFRFTADVPEEYREFTGKCFNVKAQLGELVETCRFLSF